jgi:pyruvate,water dikinase
VITGTLPVAASVRPSRLAVVSVSPDTREAPVRSSPHLVRTSGGWSIVSTAPVVALEAARSGDRDVVGGKAAALGTAAAASLPVLPGFVLPHDADARDPEVRAAWARLSDDGRRSLVVRSSAIGEDADEQSMAGMYRSVVDVRGWDAFVAAVRAVRVSGPADGDPASIAVLVQPLLDARIGGVLFGVDPVTGADHVVVAAVEGSPERLVQGAASGSRTVLGRHGHVREATGEPRLDRRLRRRLLRLAHQVEALFGGPQDVEWALDGDGRLWLLQSRPITAVAATPASRRAPVFATGPLAETFPVPLAPLEAELWLGPLRAAFTAVLDVTGVASRRRIARSAVVRAVDGWAVVDVTLLGLAPRPRALETEDVGGFGLYFVEQLTRRWGVTRENRRTRVWFELDYR